MVREDSRSTVSAAAEERCPTARAVGGEHSRFPKVTQGYSRLSKPIQRFLGKKDCLFFRLAIRIRVISDSKPRRPKANRLDGSIKPKNDANLFYD
jgi:hypothetical protein